MLSHQHFSTLRLRLRLSAFVCASLGRPVAVVVAEGSEHPLVRGLQDRQCFSGLVTVLPCDSFEILLRHPYLAQAAW
jgi:hypothetical protein